MAKILTNFPFGCVEVSPVSFDKEIVTSHIALLFIDKLYLAGKEVDQSSLRLSVLQAILSSMHVTISPSEIALLEQAKKSSLLCVLLCRILNECSFLSHADDHACVCSSASFEDSDRKSCFPLVMILKYID